MKIHIKSMKGDKYMKDRLNRDEMFYRLAHINIGLERKEDVLKDLNKVSNPNFQDLQGTSYLHMACQSHCYDAIKVLLELGADPNINNNYGKSPILKAIGSINENNNAILELMLQYGLDLDKMEGDVTLKEMIESFSNVEMNKIVNKYYHK